MYPKTVKILLMKHSVTLFLTLLLFYIVPCSAQLPALVNSDVKATLEKVIADFQNDFKNLKTDEITSNPQTTEYQTSLKNSFMEENSVVQYSASQPVYSWQATLLTTEAYEKACDKYKRFYKQLKQVSLRLTKESTIHLYGEFEEPRESSKFVSSVFDPIPASSLPRKLKVELSMQYEFPEWKVKIAIYRKEKEDEEQ